MSITIIQGSTARLDFLVTDEVGAVIDLTSGLSSVSLAVAARMDTPTLSLLIDKPLTVPGTPTNLARASFVPADTTVLTPGDYFAEIRTAFVSGDVYITPPFVLSIKDGVRA